MRFRGVIVGRTFWSLLPSGLRPTTDLLPGSPEMLRASSESWVMMVYGSPSCSIVMLSVGVRTVGGRTELYIAPETTPAVLLLGEAG